MRRSVYSAMGFANIFFGMGNLVFAGWFFDAEHLAVGAAGMAVGIYLVNAARR